MTANMAGQSAPGDAPGAIRDGGGRSRRSGVARYVAIGGLAVAGVLGLSAAAHVVGAIDRLDAVPPVSLDAAADTAAFETAAGGGGDESEAANGVEDGEDAGTREGGGNDPVFVAVPDMLVSLDAGQGRSIYVKIGFSLELADGGDAKRLKKLMPRIVDQCQVYLRELRRDDFRGSAGVLRLREELLRRVGHAVAPIQVDDVLLTGLVVQ